jgi:hypothetical protein
MAIAGYDRECAQVYTSVRKPSIDTSLRCLGFERLSISNLQRLEWDVLEAKIQRWICVSRTAVHDIFPIELRFCFHIFHDLPTSSSIISTAVAPTTHDTPFVEAVMGVVCDNPIRDNSVLSPKPLHLVIKR